MMDQDDRPVLVTGATGSTGRAVLAALTRRGRPVRAMVRREADRDRLPGGVQAVVADFDDPVSVEAALRGAGRAYLVTPSSERAGHYRRGEAAEVTTTVADITGNPPRDIGQFTRDHAPAFRG